MLLVLAGRASIPPVCLVRRGTCRSRRPGTRPAHQRPLHAFHERIAGRRGSNIATVAVARTLAVIAWHMLSRGEDYAFARPSLTREKLRRLELLTGAEQQKGKRIGVWVTKEQHRLDKQLPPKPRSPTAASSKTGSRPSRARVPHRGAHPVGRQAAKQRGRRQPHLLRFSSRSPAPNHNSRKGASHPSSNLTFIRGDGVEVEHAFEVATADDQEAVEAVAADGARPSARHGVRVRSSHRRSDHSDAFAAEDLVEGAAELAVAIVDQEPKWSALRRVQKQVARLLRDPRVVRVGGAPARCTSPGCELDEEGARRSAAKKPSQP